MVAVALLLEVVLEVVANFLFCLGRNVFRPDELSDGDYFPSVLPLLFIVLHKGVLDIFNVEGKQENSGYHSQLRKQDLIPVHGHDVSVGYCGERCKCPIRSQDIAIGPPIVDDLAKVALVVRKPAIEVEALVWVDEVGDAIHPYAKKDAAKEVDEVADFDDHSGNHVGAFPLGLALELILKSLVDLID